MVTAFKTVTNHLKQLISTKYVRYEGVEYDFKNTTNRTHMITFTGGWGGGGN